jgi:hypothetical protein
MTPRHQSPTRGRSGRYLRRAIWVMPGILLLTTGIGPAAYAFWESVSSSNFAAAAADAITPGTTPAVAANGTALSVTWPAAATMAGRSATGYTVTRYAAATGGTGIPATGACAGTVTALSCTEQSVQGGIWYYTVTPAIALWKGAESSRSNGVSNDSAAPVVSVASISPTPNAAGWNKTSPVTVNISAQDGAVGSGVASITYAIDSGTPVTVNAATAAVPVSGDGNHTLSYYATDNVGNASTTQTQNIKIDTAAPAVPSLSVPAYVNSANVGAVTVSGTAEPGAAVSLTVSDGVPANTVTPPTITASGTGSWSVSLDLTSLNQGTLSYSAKVTDAAGNISAATTTTDTKDTVAPAAPTLTTPQTYVNSGNVTNFPVNGTAEAGSSVTLTVTDAAGHSVTRTVNSSGTTWSVTGLNLSSLDDTALTFRAAATDAAGNTGTTYTAPGPNSKDVVAPAVTGFALADVGGNKANVGTASAGDTVTIQYSDSMDPSKFCPGWSGNTLFGTVTLTNGGTGGTNDTLSVSVPSSCTSLTIGTMELGGDYIGTTAAVFGTNGQGNASSLTWDSQHKILTIKLGTLSSGTPLQSSGTPSYTPAPNLTDVAGNPVSTTAQPGTGRF